MRFVYPVCFTATDTGYVAFVPDLQINTQGDTLAQAIDMARDAIGMVLMDREDDGKPMPEASPLMAIPNRKDDIVSLVDIDLDAYRREHDSRAVRKNVSLPAWMLTRAERAGLNCSQLLQDAIRDRLNIK